MSRHFELLKEIDKKFESSVVRQRGEAEPVELRRLKSKVGPRTSEALHQLVHRLFLADGNSRCVLFTGAASGVGCTWVVVHSAEALCAETTASVCLVEVGTNSSWIRQHFQVPNDKGWEVIIEDKPLHTLVRKVGCNLWVLPGANTEADDPMSSHQRLEASLLFLRQEFEYVLLDMSSATRGSRVRPGTSADGAVLVLKAGHTPRPAVKRAVDDLESTGIKVLGTVLNQREYPIPASVYKRL